MKQYLTVEISKTHFSLELFVIFQKLNPTTEIPVVKKDLKEKAVRNRRYLSAQIVPINATVTDLNTSRPPECITR